MDRSEYHYVAKYIAYAYKKSQARTRKFVSEIFKLKKGVDKSLHGPPRVKTDFKVLVQPIARQVNQKCLKKTSTDRTRLDLARFSGGGPRPSLSIRSHWYW